jgi:hypothetical protein
MSTGTALVQWVTPAVFKPSCISSTPRELLFIYLFIFWWDWVLNAGLHACKAGALPLEQQHLQSILL